MSLDPNMSMLYDRLADVIFVIVIPISAIIFIFALTLLISLRKTAIEICSVLYSIATKMGPQITKREKDALIRLKKGRRK